MPVFSYFIMFYNFQYLRQEFLIYTNNSKSKKTKLVTTGNNSDDKVPNIQFSSFRAVSHSRPKND